MAYVICCLSGLFTAVETNSTCFCAISLGKTTFYLQSASTLKRRCLLPSAASFRKIWCDVSSREERVGRVCARDSREITRPSNLSRTLSPWEQVQGGVSKSL